MNPELLLAILALPPTHWPEVADTMQAMIHERQTAERRAALAAGLRTGSGDGSGEYERPALRVVRGSGPLQANATARAAKPGQNRR
jgi:hypothetical protein